MAYSCLLKRVFLALSLVFITRKRLFALHGWFGLHLGLLLFVICFSGTVAVFTPELDAWLDPIRKAESPSPEAEKAALSEIHRSLRESYPDAFVRYLFRSQNPNTPDHAVVLIGRGDVRKRSMPKGQPKALPTAFK